MSEIEPSDLIAREPVQKLVRKMLEAMDIESQTRVWKILDVEETMLLADFLPEPSQRDIMRFNLRAWQIPLNNPPEDEK